MLDDERLLVEKINGKEVKRANPNTSMGNEETKGAFKKDLKILQESLKTLQMEGEEFDDCTPESEGIGTCFTFVFRLYILLTIL